MWTDSLWRYDDILKYIIEDLFDGFEKELCAVAGELQSFGERGMLSSLVMFRKKSHVAVRSPANISFQREKQGTDTTRRHYDNCDLLFKYHRNNSPDIYSHGHTLRYPEPGLVHIARFQCRVRGQ